MSCSKTGRHGREVTIIQSSEDRREDEEATDVPLWHLCLTNTKCQSLRGEMLMDLVLELSHGSPSGAVPQ